MPRKPAVPPQLMLETLKQFDGVILQDGRVPGPRAEVWRRIRNALEGKVSVDLLYQTVHDNRRGIYDDLLKHFNIVHPEKQRPEGEESPATSRSHSSSESSACSSETSLNANILPQQTFVLLLSPEDWSSIKPVESSSVRTDRGTKRRVLKMPPYEWEKVLIRLCWDQHKLPCPYTFHRVNISDAPYRKQYIKIDATCRECNAEATGTMLQEPEEGESAVITWRATDTRKVKHHLNRPLRGNERKRVATLLQHKSAVVFRRHEAALHMQQGDLKCPTLYSQGVLRLAKHQQLDADLRIPSKVKDPIERLVQMKHGTTCAGSIQDISADKFYVTYRTPAQDIVYKQHCASSYAVLAIDATGSIARKLSRPHGLSGHIFLYEGVLHTGNAQLPVWQVLSERHDANTINYWLNQWLTVVKVRPREVVIDDSAALKSATARAFCCSSSVAKLIEQYFSVVMGKEKSLPPCYLRLDIAHIINATKRSLKCEQSLKHFFLRCLGMLARSLLLEDFRERLFHIFVVTLSKYQGKDINGNDLPMELSLRFLTRAQKEDDILQLIESADEYLQDEEQGKRSSELSTVLRSDDDLRDVRTTDSGISDWLLNIKLEALDVIKNAKPDSDRINGYFSEDVANHFLTRAKDFPLWSAIMVNAYRSPYQTASSSTVESDFADVKSHVLRGFSTLLTVDRLVAIHLKSIEGMCRIATTEENETVRVGQRRQQDAVNRNLSSTTERNSLGEDYAKTKGNSDSNRTESDMGPIKKRVNWSDSFLNPKGTLDTPINVKREEERFPVAYGCVETISPKHDAAEDASARVVEEYSEEEEEYESKAVEDLRGSACSQERKRLQDIWKHLEPNQRLSTAAHGKELMEPRHPIVVKREEERLPELYGCAETVSPKHGIEDFALGDDFRAEIVSKIEDHESQAVEDWHGLISSQERKHSKRSSKYLDPNPYLETALHGKELKEPRSILLANGNLSKSAVPIGPKEAAIIKNTCTFDSVCQTLAALYIYNEACREEIDLSSNGLLGTAKSLATRGAVTTTYRKRAAAVISVLQPKGILRLPQNLRGKNARMTTTYEYDCYGSILSLTEDLLKSSPSVKVENACEACGTAALQSVPVITINTARFYAEGMTSFGNLIGSEIEVLAHRRTEMSLHCNCGKGKVKISLAANFLVAADYMAGDNFRHLANGSPHFRPRKLSEFPEDLYVQRQLFRLYGVVAHRPGHFVAYCRKKGLWYAYDDLMKFPMTVRDDLPIVNPQILVYGRYKS